MFSLRLMTPGTFFEKKNTPREDGGMTPLPDPQMFNFIFSLRFRSPGTIFEWKNVPLREMGASTLNVSQFHVFFAF